MLLTKKDHYLSIIYLEMGKVEKPRTSTYDGCRRIFSFFSFIPSFIHLYFDKVFGSLRLFVFK